MNMLPLSITAAHVNAPRWAELLIKSIRKFTVTEHEVIILDNGSSDENLVWLRGEAEAGRIKLIENKRNLGHGGAADQGTDLARGQYVCHMDIDSFFQRSGWERDVLDIYLSDPMNRMVAKRGGKLALDCRPFGAPIFFYERDFVLRNNVIFAYMPGILKGSTDSFQAAYWHILDLGYKVVLLPAGEKIYDPNVLGDEIWIKDKPTMYHHYYGTRFSECYAPNKHASVDGKSLEWHLKRTENIFNQPDVKAILSGE